MLTQDLNHIAGVIILSIFSNISCFSLFETVQTLWWASFGLVDLDNFVDPVNFIILVDLTSTITSTFRLSQPVDLADLLRWPTLIVYYDELAGLSTLSTLSTSASLLTLLTLSQDLRSRRSRQSSGHR